MKWVYLKAENPTASLSGYEPMVIPFTGKLLRVLNCLGGGNKFKGGTNSDFDITFCERTSKVALEPRGATPF